MKKKKKVYKPINDQQLFNGCCDFTSYARCGWVMVVVLYLTFACRRPDEKDVGHNGLTFYTQGFDDCKKKTRKFVAKRTVQYEKSLEPQLYLTISYFFFLLFSLLAS